jgi:hypothetical protein
MCGQDTGQLATAQPGDDRHRPTRSRRSRSCAGRRETGLIDCERPGTWVYYWLIPNALATLSQLLDPSALSATSATSAA